MEQELYRSRNVAKCVKAAYTLFNTNFKRIFKELWLPFLVLSLLLAWVLKTSFQTIGLLPGLKTIDLTSYVLLGCFSFLSAFVYLWALAHVFHLLNAQGLKANFIKLLKCFVVYLIIFFVIWFCVGFVQGFIKGAINSYYSRFLPEQQMDLNTFLIITTVSSLVGFLLIFIVIIPVYYGFTQFMIEDNKFRSTFLKSVKVGFKHWGFLFVIFFVIMLISLVFITILAMPIGILTITQVSSFQSMSMGDPSGLPSYFGWLYVITFTIVYFITMFFITWAIFVMYYAYGSIKCNEMDRELQKKEVVSKDTIYNT